MGVKDRISRELVEYKRILRISRKPNKEEYLKILKITSLGIAIIGAIGFVIQLIVSLF